MDAIKKYLQTFFEHIHIYDYFLIAWLTVLFLLFLVLAIKFHSKPIVAVFLILFSFAIIFIGPFIGSFYLHNKYLYSNETTISIQKKLDFSKALLITGSIKNNGTENIKGCYIHTSIFKPYDGIIEESLSYIKPIKRSTINFDNNISLKEIKNFRILIEPFNYTKDFNISVWSECYGFKKSSKEKK